MSTKACKSCDSEFKRIVSGVRYSSRGTREGFKYKDEYGQFWYGSLCARCHDQKRRLHGYARGMRKPRELINDHRFSKAVAAELTVKAYYESLGYLVEHTSGKGPDLICAKVSEKFRVEVKTAIKMVNNKNNKIYYRIGNLQRSRVKDELLATVFWNGFILIEPMKDSLKRD